MWVSVGWRICNEKEFHNLIWQEINAHKKRCTLHIRPVEHVILTQSQDPKERSPCVVPAVPTAFAEELKEC